MSENITNINDSSFEQDVIEKSKETPVLVDFWAEWCAPCRMLGPTLETVAKGFDGKVHIAKLNVDENPASSQKYGIMSIPAVKLFVNGKVVDEFVGALPQENIEQFVNKHI